MGGSSVALVMTKWDLDPVPVGWEAACGGMAAAWWLSAWKKWKMSGFDWMSANTIGLLIAERAYIGHPHLPNLRRFVLTSSSFSGSWDFAVYLSKQQDCFSFS